MLTITIETPQGTILFEHSKNRVVAKGPKIAVDLWNIEVNRGLYGVHGHIFKKNDCDIADVINAATNYVGMENVTIPENSQKQAEIDLQSYPSNYPKDPLP